MLPSPLDQLTPWQRRVLARIMASPKPLVTASIGRNNGRRQLDAIAQAAAIPARDQLRCVACSHYGGNVHHRKRRSQGGSNQASNLLLLCGSGTTGCHGFYHAHPEVAMQLGYLVSQAAAPAQTPVWHLGWGAWVLLRDDLTVKLIDAPPGSDARNYTPREDPDD